MCSKHEWCSFSPLHPDRRWDLDRGQTLFTLISCLYRFGVRNNVDYIASQLKLIMTQEINDKGNIFPRFWIRSNQKYCNYEQASWLITLNPWVINHNVLRVGRGLGIHYEVVGFLGGAVPDSEQHFLYELVKKTSVFTRPLVLCPRDDNYIYLYLVSFRSHWRAFYGHSLVDFLSTKPCFRGLMEIILFES